jgi:hypothetical protein
MIATSSRPLVFKRLNFALLSLSLAGFTGATSVSAQGSPSASPEQGLGLRVSPMPTTVRGTFENWRLPDGQNAGMLGLNVLFDIDPSLKLGVASYGALTGQQGGLMTLGLAAELEHDLSQSWRIHAGVFAGGGGGASGYSLTGNGFMFRTDAGLTYRTQGFGNLGVGVSWVTFPSGQIRSAQPYLMYEYTFDTLISPGWKSSKTTAHPSGTASITSQRQEIGIAWSQYVVPSSVTNDTGTRQGNIDLAGARWTRYLDDRWFLSIQADGSYTSSTSGYVQILGGAGYRLPLGSSTGLKIYGLAGPAGSGNGAVSTGGGLLLGGGLAIQQMLTNHWAIEVGVGGTTATTGDFKGWMYGVNLSYVFGTPRAMGHGSSATMPSDLNSYTVAPLRLRAMNETFLQADDQWRNNDTNKSVNNLGLGLDYFLEKNAYLTGQALVAYTGNSKNGSDTAAMELTGLAGAGWLQPLSPDWFVMAEGLLGVSVGGSLSTGVGGVWQVNAGLGYRLTNNLDLMLTGGRMQAFDGQFKANIVTVGLGYRFGLPNR